MLTDGRLENELIWAGKTGFLCRIRRPSLPPLTGQRHISDLLGVDWPVDAELTNRDGEFQQLEADLDRLVEDFQSRLIARCSGNSHQEKEV